MKVPAKKLEEHLSKNLANLYIICGDEPILVKEAQDQIRSKATSLGFSERKSITCSSKEDYAEIGIENNSLSLFSEKKIIEVKFSKQKFSKEEIPILTNVCSQLNPDNTLILIFPKLDRKIIASPWFKSLEQLGILIEIWPIKANELIYWIKNQLSRYQINLSNDAVQLLNERVEGNLVAASHEIEKIRLLEPEAQIGLNEMLNICSNSEKFDPYQFIDDLLAGKSEKSLRVLHSFKDDGFEEIFLLWLITKELRILYRAKEESEKGIDPKITFRRLGVWEKRIPIFYNSINRVKINYLRMLLSQASALDLLIKGLRKGDIWQELTLLALSISGRQIISPKNIKLLVDS